MKILIIGPSWIGDTVLSQGLYNVLIQQNVNTKIDVISTTCNSPLLNRMPEINEVITTPFNHGILKLKKRYEFSKSLRNRNYNQAFILPNSFKSALIPFFAKIPKRTGWLGEMRYGILNDIYHNKHNHSLSTMEKYAILALKNNNKQKIEQLLKKIEWPKLNISSEEIKNTLIKFKVNNKKPLIGFCHGSGSKANKKWPHYHFTTLASALINNGYQIMLFGAQKDINNGKKIYNMIPTKIKNNCHDFTGKTSIDEVISLIATCNGIISNDTGLMHIACAINKPTVVLYGPTNPKITPPLTKKSCIICSTTTYRKIKTKKIKDYYGYSQSLINIKPTLVLQKLKQLLISSKDIDIKQKCKY